MDNKNKNRKGRLSRTDWLDAALDLLEKEGIDKVRVERLSTELGVTKGSFYWHFRDREDLLESLLEHYHMTCTVPVIEEISKLDLPAAQLLAEVERIVENIGITGFERAVYAWALYDPKAREYMEKEVDRRKAFILELFTEAGFEGDEAETRARMFIYRQFGRLLMDIPEQKGKREPYARIRMELLTGKPKK